MATYDQRSTGTDLVSHVLLMVPSSVAPPAGTSGPRDFATTPARMSSAPHSTADAGPGPATRRPAPGANRRRAAGCRESRERDREQVPVSRPWLLDSANMV